MIKKHYTVLQLNKLNSLAQAASAHLTANRLIAAERCYRQLIEQAPLIPEAYNNLGTVLKEQGRIAESHKCFKKSLQLRPHYPSAHSNLLFTLHYETGQTLAGLQVAHTDWAKSQLLKKPSLREHAPRKKSDDHSIITIGLVSPDFYYHPVAVFLLPWLLNRNSQRVRLIAYSDRLREDPMTQKIRDLVDVWRPIHGQTDTTVLHRIKEDHVDILIDLAGHTAGNRLTLFAQRGAPNQVSWLGYWSTTGVPAMDALFMDDVSLLPGDEIYFTEKVIRLKSLRFCYSPPEYAPAVCEAPAQKNGFITFGSFNNLGKITGEVVQTWATILHQAPKSRLILKWKSLGDEETREKLLVSFAACGVPRERIECRGWSQHIAMLKEYGDIDIALDTFPFSGGLTSCDALFMGVPVLTLPGELPISRQTTSFLHAMGMIEWVAEDREDYIERAVKWAQSAESLSVIRAAIRNRLLSSMVCDGKAYADAIEDALEHL
jgi:protein O-GlcNAc transferase